MIDSFTSQKWKSLKMCPLYLLHSSKRKYLMSTYAIVDWQRRFMCKRNKKLSEIAVIKCTCSK